MAEPQENQNTNQLEQGTYEIIQNRLQKQKTDLLQRLQQLNEARKEVFGSIATELLATTRITTPNNCIATDIASLGKVFIFGYNVHIGLRSSIKLEDVFSIYQFKDNDFVQQDLSLLNEARFLSDFENVYKYYRETVFERFAIVGNYLYMIFQLSKVEGDEKAFKWLIKDGKLEYVDDRSIHEFSYPDQYEFKWKQAKRETHREGKFPHVSIMDRVFVETTGGDLTIKVEDNTDTGMGVYAEEVKQKEQSLDDAEFWYADLGNLIALKIKPYQESYRYFVYNEKVQQAQRIDALQDSGVLLPDNQGLIFSNGYYLQTGDFKKFDNQISNLQYERRIASPNGEDWLYVFHQDAEGIYILLSYNVIDQTVKTPIICHGFTLFEDGRMSYFKKEDKPAKHHAIQIWQTPYLEGEFNPVQHKEKHLYKVGNKDIVSAMAEIQAIVTLLNKEDSYGGLYLDLVKKTGDIIDSYYWINHDEAYQLDEPLKKIKEAASTAIDEFDKVQKLRNTASTTFKESKTRTDKLLVEAKRRPFESIQDYVEMLSEMRLLRGELITQKSIRYIDVAGLEEAEKKVAEQINVLSEKCIHFLAEDGALAPYTEMIQDIDSNIGTVEKVTEGKELATKIEETAGQLNMLIEVVSNLQIEDATLTGNVIERISAKFALLNQSKAALKKKLTTLQKSESNLVFNAQINLIDQATLSYLDLAETPTACDELLNKLMIQLEELESRFVDIDEFQEPIASKREEIYNAFETKRLSIVENQNKRSLQLFQSAERILKSVQSKSEKLESPKEINAYFASDFMIEKIRQIVEQLLELNDTVKAEDIQTKLKSLQQDALRQLDDRKELFKDGSQLIKIGKHSFYVNTQKLELTIVERSGQQFYHLTGTNFFIPIDDKELESYQHLRNQSYISENKEVYRGEYLAYQYLLANPNADLGDDLQTHIQKFAQKRLNEAYVKGVHDYDASVLVRHLASMEKSLEILKHAPEIRSIAKLFWEHQFDKEQKTELIESIKSAAFIIKAFPENTQFNWIKENLKAQFLTCLEGQLPLQSLLSSENLESLSQQMADYLFDFIAADEKESLSYEADEFNKSFKDYLKDNRLTQSFDNSIKQLGRDNAVLKFLMIHQWLEAFYQKSMSNGMSSIDKGYLSEVAWELMSDGPKKTVANQKTFVAVNDLKGDHPVMQEGVYYLSYHAFKAKMQHFIEDIGTAFTALQERKHALITQYREQLQLDNFKAKVMSSFIRNRLIDEVYFPLIGDNFAKQLGAAGDTKNTDRSGLLLLISPPGYGKTTLMEYLSNRLGLTFMKINGPAIGHEMRSIDPNDAPNAAAKQEIEKLNLAFEMGDNVMIYLDDIQHCNPELLQKFISLCDAQRKIEGVFNGKSKTYDLRGKKVCIVMAGNPYTESGEQFQIPDMLANRADIYNLGDIIGDTANAFKLSYLENAVSANTTMMELFNKSRKDLYSFVQLAETGNIEGIEWEVSHSPEEMEQYVKTLQNMLFIRDVILKVNLQYIQSAAQADEYRQEPPFKLQGSYRDMNKMAAKVVAVMNTDERNALILSHYESEAQTLTSNAEANLLKFKSMMDWLSEEEAERWKFIKESFAVHSGGGSENQMANILFELRQTSKDLMDQKDRMNEVGDEQLASILTQLRQTSKDLMDQKDRINDVSDGQLATILTELRQTTRDLMEQKDNLNTTTADNLDKFKEMMAFLSTEEVERWKYIKDTFIEQTQRSDQNNMAEILAELRRFTQEVMNQSKKE